MFASNHLKQSRDLVQRCSRISLRGLALLGVCLVAWLSGGVANANPKCACVSPGITIWPTDKQAAPLNTRVWVRLPALSQKLFFGRYQEFKNYPNLWASSFTLSQIKVALLHKGRLVKAVRWDLKSGDWRMLIIEPKVALLPQQRYDVRMGVGAWGAAIGHFTTGAANANAKLPAASVDSTRYVWDRTIRDHCLSPKPYATVHLDNKPDRVRAPLLGIWAAGADGTIDFKRKPTLILPALSKRFFLGRASYCSETNFALAGGTSVTFGIKAGNLADQWGPPTTVSFATSAPIAPWTWSPNMRVVFWVALGFLIFLLGLLRVWLIQRKSFTYLDDFAFDHSSIKSDVSWLALRKVVEKEAPYRRANLALFFAQLVLLVLGVYVLLRSMTHFVVSHNSLTQLTILVGTVGLFLLLNGLINFAFTRRIRAKRHQIGCFEVGANFQKPCATLLKGWRKKGAKAPSSDNGPQRGATA